MSNEDPQAKPPIPPVPPAPPAPPVPPVPQYGEYAPQGATPPTAVPTPAPEYGYAAAPQDGYPAAKPGRKRRTWDLVLTIVLLVMGLFGMGIGLLYAWIFSDAAQVSEIFSTQGYEWNGTTGSFSLIIVVTHLVLYLAVVAISIPLLIKGRIVVFWIPLAAGVIAAIIFWVAIFGVLLSDPSFVDSVNSVS